MITVYYKTEAGFQPLTIRAEDKIPSGVAWIDLHNPTSEEEQLVESQRNQTDIGRGDKIGHPAFGLGGNENDIR